MRKTACPVVWEGGGAQSPSLDPIELRPPHIAPQNAGYLSQADTPISVKMDGREKTPKATIIITFIRSNPEVAA